MLLRNTSAPFRYTTAPSSRRRRRVNAAKAEGLATVNARRKYVVTYLALAFGPKETTVASSPSPYPSWAAPDVQDPSAKPAARQAVPWFDPLSRYFQAE